MHKVFRASMPVSVLSIMVTLTGSAQGDDWLFEAPWRAFNTGDFPTFAPSVFDMGDLNGDGNRDIVAGFDFFGAPGLSVLMSNGDGSYAPEVIYETGYGKTIGDVRLVDFDMDGDLDVLASIPDHNGLNDKVALWRNSGNGSLGAPNLFVAGPGPTGIAVGDFNGDGFPDLVTGNAGYVAGQDQTISLLRHNGQTGAAAGFLAAVQFQVGDNPYRVEAADLDGDDDLDLAIGRASIQGQGDDAVSIIFNNGSGSFSAPVHYPPATNYYVATPAIALADIDNDGDKDLLSSAAQNGGGVYGIIALRRNDGSGAFGSIEEIHLEEWTYRLDSIGVADLNRDGWLDIYGSTPSGRASDGFNVVLSNGSGGFQPAIRYEAGKHTQDLMTDDVDDDGDVDIITAANDSSVMTVHLNEGDGTFLVLPRFETAGFSQWMDWGDLDLDGDLDIIAAAGSVISVLHNSGTGTFVRFDYAPPMIVGHTILRDLNNDGYLDLVMADNPNNPPYHFATALNNGNGTFAQGVITPVGACQAGRIEAADFNNDGFRDIALTDPSQCAAIYIFRNGGNGVNFIFENTLTGGGIPWGVVAADFDGDGNNDLMSSLSIGLSTLQGHGDFTFGGPVPTGPDGAFDFEITDLNDDSYPDVIYIVPQDSFGVVFVATMRNYGDGAFAFPHEYAMANGREGAFRIVSDIRPGDVNGDGHIDIITANNAPNDISVLFGNGDGTMQPLEQRYGMGYSNSQVAVGEFTGDSLADVAGLISLPPSGFGNAVVLLKGANISTGKQIAQLLSATVAFGTLIEGDLSSLAASDDFRLRARSHFGFVSAEPNVLDLHIAAQTAVASPALIDLKIESRVSVPGAVAKVRLRNWSNNQLQQVRQYSVGTTEAVEEILGVSAADRVRQSDKRIELSIRQSAMVVFSSAGFDGFFDHVEVAVE